MATSKPPSPPAPRPLADILRDPDTDWSDIRSALKTQGRGSTLVTGLGSGSGRNIGATTNAGLLRALRESAARPDGGDPGEGTISGAGSHPGESGRRVGVVVEGRLLRGAAVPPPPAARTARTAKQQTTSG